MRSASIYHHITPNTSCTRYIDSCYPPHTIHSVHIHYTQIYGVVIAQPHPSKNDAQIPTHALLSTQHNELKKSSTLFSCCLWVCVCVHACVCVLLSSSSFFLFRCAIQLLSNSFNFRLCVKLLLLYYYIPFFLIPVLLSIYIIY